MATSDAMPVPRKGAAYRAYAPVFDADGDLVSGITGQDTEVSKDGGAFADCTNEFVEIGTSGIGYIDLTSTEMNADAVVVRVQVTNSGAKTTPIFLYPQEAGDIPVTVEAMNAGTVTASAIATGAIDADAIAADAITDAKVASDVTIASVTGAVGSVTGAVGSVTGNVGGNVVGSVGSVSGAVGSVTGNVGGNVAGSVGSVTGSVGSVAAGGITASSIATGAVDADALAADAVAEIAAGISIPSAATVADAVWNEVAADHDTAGTTGAALNDAGASGDPLTNTVPGSYASGTAGHALGRIGSGQITTVSIVTQAGNIDEIIQGSDYLAADGRSFDQTDTGNVWPTLTAATVTWYFAHPNGQTTSFAGSVVTATGSGKKVRLELTDTQTTALAALGTGVWTFMTWAVTSGGSVIPLVGGTAPVKNGPGPA